jgi:hypothetical protein
MKPILVAAAALVILACACQGNADAQGINQGAPGEMKGGRGHKGANDYRKEEVKPRIDEKAYQDALQKIPDSNESYDPWGGVRSDSAKTGSSKSKKPTK